MTKKEYLEEFKKKLDDTYLLDFLCSILHNFVDDYNFNSSNPEDKKQTLELSTFSISSDLPSWFQNTRGLSREQYKLVINKLIDRILSR